MEFEYQSNDLSAYGNIEYLGAATARYCNVIAIDEKHVMFPLNSELHIWSYDTRLPLPSEDLKEEEKSVEKFDGRLEIKQSIANANIQVLVESDSTWVGVTYDGEVIVIQKQDIETLKQQNGFQQIARLKTDCWFVRDAAVSKSGDTIAFISEAPEDNSFVMLSLENQELKIIQEIKNISNCVIRQCCFDSEGTFYVLAAKYQFEMKYGKERKVFKQHYVLSYVKEGEFYELIKELTNTPEDKACDPCFLALYDTSNSSIVHLVKVSEYSPPNFDIIEESDLTMVVPALDSHSMTFSIVPSKDFKMVKMNPQDFEMPTNVMHNSKLLNQEILVMFTDSGMIAHKIEITPDGENETWKGIEKFEHNVIHLSGCAIDMNKAGDLVCFGDLSGRLHVYLRKLNPTTKRIEFVREKPFKFQHSVRSLRFHPLHHNTLLVGLTSGWIFFVDPIRDVVADIGCLNDNVTSLKWYQNYYPYTKCEHILMAASSNGTVKFYAQDQNNDTVFNEVGNLQAHEKSDVQDENFGSLHKYSEVWNLVPQSYYLNEDMLKYFVTCSEDQTCKVWKMTSSNSESFEDLKFECLDVLEGHTKAVTDVAWCKMSPEVLGEEYKNDHVFASCSDDQTVRIYRVSIEDKENIKFEHLYNLDTHFIQDWHTITYMALEENGKRVAVVTQNGCLVIWELSASDGPKMIFGRKIHTGGVEGLRWTGGKLLTLSSDCTACCLRMPQGEEYTVYNPSSKGFTVKL